MKSENENGKAILNKGQFKEYCRKEIYPYIDLERGETFNDWFETYFDALIDDEEAVKVGNHYEIEVNQ